jgi:hypothetical protein
MNNYSTFPTATLTLPLTAAEAAACRQPLVHNSEKNFADHNESHAPHSAMHNGHYTFLHMLVQRHKNSM